MRWQTRLEKWFESDNYTFSNQEESTNLLEVTEETDEGRGRVEFFCSNHLLKINSGNLNHLPFLKDSKNADGVFLEFKDGEVIALHIVELKKTINLTKWDEVKNQIRSSLRHSLGFLGVLDLKLPEKLVCHTCYQNDEVLKQIHANPVLSKAMLGQQQTNTKQDFLGEWLADQVEISNVFPVFDHRKHHMDSVDRDDIPYKKVKLDS